MRHFLNRDMLAPNVMTFDIDSAIVGEFACREHLAGRYATVRPKDWHSDIDWISAADEEAFEVFQSAFDRLGIGDRFLPYLDVKAKVRLYAGFLVIRSECTQPHFHVDWASANNEAFSMLTPVTAAAEDFGLLYHRLDGTIGQYDYKCGEAIGFGDRFSHSTKPGRSDGPAVLLCFEFGTDRMEHWPKIYETIGYQVTRIRQPDGRFVQAHGKTATRPA